MMASTIKVGWSIKLEHREKNKENRAMEMLALKKEHRRKSTQIIALKSNINGRKEKT
ncbi:MAG: hypothetical protein ACPGVD_00970 [Flavobacteriales bacterium]